jgi:hypothetical protein
MVSALARAGASVLPKCNFEFTLRSSWGSLQGRGLAGKGACGALKDQVPDEVDWTQPGGSGVPQDPVTPEEAADLVVVGSHAVMDRVECAVLVASGSGEEASH